MPGFLYFHPKVELPPTAAEIERIGLAYALAGANLTAAGVGKGPGDQRGVILADTDQTTGRAAIYAPEDQAWRKVPNTEAWVGHWNEARPAPTDLLRSRFLPGYGVMLGDGNDWVIPVVRAYREAGDVIQGDPALPKKMDVDQAGKLTPGALLPEYEPLWQAVAEAWDKIIVGEGELENRIESGVAEFDALAIRLLAANYRLGPAEVVMLELFECPNVANTVAILSAATDVLSYVQIKKEQAARTSGTSDGSEVSTPATSPA